MQAMFFGPSDKQLFGVYYPPQSHIARDRGVILCNPIQACPCRCLHHLATLFAKAGLPAFRFDYFGTADSSGDMSQSSVSQWLQDIHCAATELRQRGSERLSIVGLCFGATLAALYSKEHDSVDSLVLWEPWVSGEDCIRDMQRRWELDFTSAGVPYPAIENELLGSPFPAGLRAEICSVHLGGSFVGPGPPVLLIEHGTEEASGLRQELEKSGCTFQMEVAALPPFWEDDLALTFVPRPLLERIVGWVSSG